MLLCTLTYICEIQSGAAAAVAADPANTEPQRERGTWEHLGVRCWISARRSTVRSQLRATPDNANGFGSCSGLGGEALSRHSPIPRRQRPARKPINDGTQTISKSGMYRVAFVRRLAPAWAFDKS